MPRIFAISDIHIDYPDNMTQMLSLSDSDYREDTLIIAGDCTDSLDRLTQLFESLRKKFSTICFVPGNHELWVRQSSFSDSIQKFDAIIDLCRDFGVRTEPYNFKGKSKSIWLVPLFSWYRLPEYGDDTLYIEKVCENRNQFVWSDDRYCKWPAILDGISPADYFSQLNATYISDFYEDTVISFSHFLPRRDLIFEPIEIARIYGDGKTPIQPHPLDPHPYFNFSRVAGDQKIESQIRRLKSIIHVYGHQHRNRDRTIDGVRYVSHCLGNQSERKFLTQDGMKPKCIWED